MQNIIELLHVMSSNISKTYQQYPVKLNILRNKIIILILNQVHIERYRNSQPILTKPHQPYTLVVLKYHHQWIHCGLIKVNPYAMSRSSSSESGCQCYLSPIMLLRPNMFFATTCITTDITSSFLFI
jgi:hypothetical protein